MYFVWKDIYCVRSGKISVKHIGIEMWIEKNSSLSTSVIRLYGLFSLQTKERSWLSSMVVYSCTEFGRHK